MIDLNEMALALQEAGFEDVDMYWNMVAATARYEEGMGARAVDVCVKVFVDKDGHVRAVRERRLVGATRTALVGGVIDVAVSGESTDTTRFVSEAVKTVSDVLAVLQFVKRGGDRGTGTVSANGAGAIPVAARPGRRLAA